MASMRSMVSDMGCNPLPALAARQGHIQCPSARTGPAVRRRPAPGGVPSSGLDGLLGQVDGGTAVSFVHAQAAMPFISSVMRFGLAQELGLGIFRSAGLAACAKPPGTARQWRSNRS